MLVINGIERDHIQPRLSCQFEEDNQDISYIRYMNLFHS